MGPEQELTDESTTNQVQQPGAISSPEEQTALPADVVTSPTTEDTISPESSNLSPTNQGSTEVPAPTLGASTMGAIEAQPVAVSSPVSSVAPANGANTSPVTGNVNTPRPGKHAKLLLLSVALLVILFAGTAAAYFTVIVPNQPQNLLKTAIENTLNQRQVTSNLTFDASPASGSSGVAYKVTANASSNLNNKSLDIVSNVTVSGVSIPVEARLIDQNVYVKFGDLSNVTSLVNSLAPGQGAAVNSVAKEISNQWVVFDSTLLKEAGAGCVLDTNWAITKSDITALQAAYQKNSFVTINSASSDTVNGQAAEKFVLSINDNKGAQYMKSLSGLSMVQALQKCQKGTSAINTSSLADGDTTPLTVWVDKGSKRIVKFDMQSTPQDAQKSHLQGDLTATLSYNPVNISTPNNAVPAIQMLAQIENSHPQLVNALSATGQ